VFTCWRILDRICRIYKIEEDDDLLLTHEIEILSMDNQPNAKHECSFAQA